MEKLCTKCKVVKSLSEFGNDVRVKGGKESQCRECENGGKFQWRQNNRNYERERDKLMILISN